MIIFYYILKEYFKYVFETVILSVFLFILFDFIHKTTKYFAEYQPKSIYVIEFYLYQLPLSAMQAIPIASLLASVICMVLLSRTNEITAMRAAGMSPMAIGLPLAFGGLILSAISFILSEGIIPVSSQKMRYVEQVLIEGESSLGFSGEARWLRRGKVLFNFRDYDPLERIMHGVRIITLSNSFYPEIVDDAATAEYMEKEKLWKLLNIQSTEFDENGQIVDRKKFRRNRLDLPFIPEKLKKERRKPNELSLKELDDIIVRGEQLGLNILPYRVDWHIKLAYPFAALIVSLIGLRFGYRSERATETAKGVLVAFTIGISYWFILQAGRALGMEGAVHPIFAGWLANITVALAVAFEAWQAKKTI